MVWTYTEEGQWIYRTKDAEHGAVDLVKENIQRVAVTEEDAKHRLRLRQMNCCGDPYRQHPKKEEEEKRPIKIL